MKRILSLLTLAIMALSLQAKPVTVNSPDGRLSLTVDGLHYSIAYNGECLIQDAEAGLVLEGKALDPKVRKTTVKSGIREHIDAPLYRQAAFDYVYNMVRLEFKDGFSLEWRVSDEGAAYRFAYSGKGEVTVADETVRIPFAFDAKAWMPYASSKEKPYAISFESSYTEQHLTDGCDRPAFLPSAFEAPSGVKLTLLESDIRSYPGMFIRPSGTSIVGEFPRYPVSYRHDGKDQYFVETTENYIAKTVGARTYPWRIFAVAAEDRMMPTNNLVYALASPCKLADTSWITPGFSAWEWWNDWDLYGVDFVTGINMDTYRYYIDFAAKSGLEYLVLDEGWYPSDKGDMYEVLNGLDIPELVSYADKRGVKLILWCVFTSLDKKLDEYCRHYSEMGIAGFKVDFMDRNDQVALETVWRIAETAAKYHLVLDFHGIFPPMGMNRTYPNVLNYEAIKGQENSRWSTIEQFDMGVFDVTFPFIRQMAGYSDYTPGAMRNSVKADFHPNWRHSGSQGTRARQVALYIVTDAPLAMLCDSPSNYYKEQETVDYITCLPRKYEETVCLDGKVGEYIVMARRDEDGWYVGGLNNWEERDLEIPLSFISGAEETHYVEIYRDGINAAHNGEDYAIDLVEATRSDVIKVHLAPGGGFAMIIN